MIGSGELFVVLLALLLLFGGKRLPEFARNLGSGLKEFKKALEGEHKDQNRSDKDRDHDGRS